MIHEKRLKLVEEEIRQQRLEGKGFDFENINQFEEEVEEKEVHEKNKHKYQEMIDRFIFKAIVKGKTKDEIKSTLISARWPKNFIERYCDYYFAKNKAIVEKASQQARYNKLAEDIESLK